MHTAYLLVILPVDFNVMTRINQNRVFLLSASSSDEDKTSNINRKSKEIQKVAEQRSPIRLFAEDVFLLFANLALFPYVLIPFRKVEPLPGVKTHTARVTYGWIVLTFLALVEGPLLLGSIPIFLIYPGWIFFSGALSCFLLVLFLAWTTWGSLVLRSDVEVDETKFHTERWFYINGITTRSVNHVPDCAYLTNTFRSHAGLQQDIDNLSATFGRAVTGIHNRSFGLPFDLIECLIQRSFSYHTSDVRVATASLTMALEDPTVTKVVVLAHSQGGLILSLVLDHLYTVLPAGIFTKLEIYTMGSAANFFHNPLIKHFSANVEQSPKGVRSFSKSATAPAALITTAEQDVNIDTDMHHPEIPNQLIHTIEHYVNGLDLVPRWGVLYSILLGTECDYSGRVFVHEHASGHLFDRHYLSTMFPLSGLQQIYEDDPEMFLNHKVQLEDNGKGTPNWGMFRALTDLTERAVDPPAPTVRRLSKLWRYMGGSRG